MKENFTNFATTALVSPSPLTVGGTSFTVTGGQGSLFPASNFIVTIDSEIILIASRSGDTFTVGQRGYDNSVAATHSVGVTIQLSDCAQLYNHLWQNVADTFNPLVPPIQQPGGLIPSSWDNEFESLGSWTLFPTSPSGSSLWNINTSLRSHLVLNRSSSDNTLYTAYIGFNPPASTPFMITWKLSQAISFAANPNSSNQASTWLQVTDQTNPTASVGSGNRVQLKITLENTTQSTSSSNAIFSPINQIYVSQIVYHSFASGVSGVAGTVVTLAPGIPLFARMYFDGAGNYTVYFGDGTTFWALFTANGKTFTPQSIAIQFDSTSLAVTQAIDFVRVVTGSGLNPTLGY